MALEALNLARELGGPGAVPLEDGLELVLTMRASASIIGAVMASRNLASTAPSSRSWRYAVPVRTDRWPLGLTAPAAGAGVGVLVGRALMTGLLAGPDPMTNERLAVHPDALGAREWWLWTRRRGVPLQAVALQFPMRHPQVGTVVVGASNPREIEENVAAATFAVPDEIWAELDERMRRA